ncbi:multicopper oxidase-domain-containing protein [Truncatella angustata]|uniref:Multicopper oxidase-domain-containing protein n=1 Tax=Truncatella angustata TaxID=152316 RepID=A0A9P8RJG4_9PEZI|nr:multicopper oxidase-domain-containing protein [Truncatella angustata]KAH6647163.1 multicopper oxidase-domain-containing protein [Truncatella angustata]
MAFLQGCGALLGALSPDLQDGKSLWGTLDQPCLGLWIQDNGINSESCPWGDLSENNNPYHSAPDTGMTRYYDFSITRGYIQPDGYNKSVILVNEQFPGPIVEANWGDWIEVTVSNNIETVAEGTSLHWHGLLMEGTPWMDGVPGVSQCPIAPGSKFTYRFRATLYGTSWYHSHYSSQYSGGLHGPIVIHGPTQLSYDTDIGPIEFEDWWHQEYYEVVESIMQPNFSGRSFSDSNLIQGKNNFNCSSVSAGDTTNCTDNAGLAKFRFQSGKMHRLRLINSGSQGTQRISIDEHTMTVIAYDFVPVQPYNTTVVTLGVGQRADVLVKANAGEPGSSFWLRANLTSCASANAPNALAAILYEDADPNEPPTSQAWDVPDPGNCANDPLEITIPFFPIELPEATYTQNLDIGSYINESDNYLWTFGNVSARVDYNSPSMLQVKDGNFSFSEDMNVINFGTNSSVRLIINNPSPAPHPIHAHGLNMYTIADGAGDYSADNTAFVRPENPMRRDVQNVRAFGHIVVQLETSNPGMWPFHCHVTWHASAGFFAQLLFQPDELIGLEIPDNIASTCAEWDEFTSRSHPDQIDSGL